MTSGTVLPVIVLLKGDIQNRPQCQKVTFRTVPSVILYERIDTAFTYLNKETGLFKVVNVPFVNTLSEYVELATKTAEEQQAYFTGPLGNDVFQCSPMPWVTYTHISHTNSGKKDNATPLFDWGKYYEKDGRILIPISIQAHHSFVDGIHIGKLVDGLQQFFDEY